MIRELTFEDVDALIPLGHEFYAASGLPGKFNEVTFSNVLKAIVAGGIPTLTGILYGLFDDSGKLVGSIGGLVTVDFLTGDVFAQETFWFITKEYRGGTGGLKLLTSFENKAKELGATRVHMLHLQSMGNDSQLSKIYSHRGYTLIEQMYSKELN